MAEIWTIKGEAGKAMDATERTLSAIGALAPKLAFRNLAADTLTWAVLLDGLAPAAEIIPELGQVVTLQRSAARFFRGHVTGVRQSGSTVAITVSGPWWWLERVFLESTQTDGTGATGQRATFSLPIQALDASLGALLTAARTMGCEFDVGALAATFTAPPLRLNQMSFAQAVGEVCRVTPDLVLWWDYAVAGAWPQARTSRRLTATSATLDAATLEEFDLNPVTELQVSKVEIPYLVRAADGKKQFATQSAGALALGKVQLLTVSGDEMDTFLPKDDFESATVQTAASLASNTLTASRDASLAALAGIYGGLPGGITDYIDAYVTSYDPGAYNGRALRRHQFPPYTITTEAGLVLTATAKKLVISGDLPEWAMKMLGGIRVSIAGTWAILNTSGTYSELERALQNGGSAGYLGWRYPSGAESLYYSARPFSFSGVLIDAAYLAAATLYKPWEYDFIAPPAGFTAGLLAAQNYIPVEGLLAFLAEEAGATRYMPSAINVSNASSAFATMRAMISAEELDLEAGLTTLTLGAPARFSYKDLVNKMRGSSNDNIVYL